MKIAELMAQLPTTALAFRGYNVLNLGRTPELLAHPAYGPLVERRLAEASDLCSDYIGRRVHLVDQVRQRREIALDHYAEALTLVLTMERVQLELLGEFFGVDYRGANLSLGFSLGEIAALVAGGVVDFDQALMPPLKVADDAAALAEGVTLAVLFNRGRALPRDTIERLVVEINAEGRGVLGVSTILSPNSVLLMGQEDTLDRFKLRLEKAFDDRVFLRKNEHRWPPLHTPITWQKLLPTRSALLMQTMRGGLRAPRPPVLSLVTGDLSYNDHNARDILCRWVDHPQRLWDAVNVVFARGVTTVLHVGPAPNILPATFQRLADNVRAQTKASVGVWAMSGLARRRWLQPLLPAGAALLRAPRVRQLILEDWLLEHSATPPETRSPPRAHMEPETAT